MLDGDLGQGDPPSSLLSGFGLLRRLALLAPGLLRPGLPLLRVLAPLGRLSIARHRPLQGLCGEVEGSVVRRN